MRYYPTLVEHETKAWCLTERWHSLSQEASAVPMSPGVLPGATGPVLQEQGGGGRGVWGDLAQTIIPASTPSPDALWALSNACSSLKSIAAPGAKKPHVNPGLSDRQMSLWAKAWIIMTVYGDISTTVKPAVLMGKRKSYRLTNSNKVGRNKLRKVTSLS